MSSPTYILGINCAYHDSSACLLVDGELVAAVEEERLSRVKHAKEATVDSGDQLPVRAIRAVLEQAGVPIERVAHAGLSIDPDGRPANVQADDPVVEGDWGSASGEALFRRTLLTLPEQLAGLGFGGRVHWLRHHLCHAASAYYPSGFERAAVLTVDGIGEADCSSFAAGEGPRLELLETFTYPHSIGFLWEKLCTFLGFNQYDAYKVMGLAGFGDPGRYASAFEGLARLDDAGLLRVDGAVARFRVPDLSGIAAALGLPPRAPGAPLEPEHADVAAALQALTERAVLGLARALHRRTRANKLCLAGGVALNCVANRLLIEQGPFEEVFIQPAASDAGTAIGAATWLWSHHLGHPAGAPMRHAFLGPCFDDAAILAALASRPALRWRRSPDVEREVAERLASGALVAWFQGAMEFGPRGLGHRSLLADPRDAATRDRINAVIKHREGFRPFAPSILAEEVDQWFSRARPSRADELMLVTYPAKEITRARAPAVVHVNGMSRIQAVRADVDPRYHRLISCFRDLTGVPMLLNTSLNDSEPIVCSPADAIATFERSALDLLVLGDHLVERP